MSVWQVLVFSIVEGLTEFLPVSSTAHLILTARFLGVAQSEFVKLFEVVIQFGAILAVVLLYSKMVLKNKKLFFLIMASLIPTVVVGFLLYSVIKNVFFESLSLIALSLFVGGVLFLLVEYLVAVNYIKLSLTKDSLSWSSAVIIGLAQSLAVVPGVSRAGAVILCMLMLGYKRKTAVEYSFLLSVPTIALASGYDLYKTASYIKFARAEIFLILLGVVLSFVSAYFVIKLFLDFVKKHSLTVFGFYRIALAVLLWLFFS
ncbi:MAG: undecaprenyl-diphosphatase [Patescibacteria group bacterium]|nr:MAG: undecaprenyl-diphosphatase [Patescibacteria group bacterium]